MYVFTNLKIRSVKKRMHINLKIVYNCYEFYWIYSFEMNLKRNIFICSYTHNGDKCKDIYDNILDDSDIFIMSK